MSVTVRHINGDSSFLLLLSPEAQPSSRSTCAGAAYSILVDPWVQGPSVVTAPWFAITRRVVPACIKHLSELEEPDVVIVSQNKPDHCHQDTLRQLRPDGKTIIAAEPGAATAIKSWNHFDPARIQSLPKFNPHKRFSCATFYIPPLSPAGHRGVVTVSFIPAKNYMTGLHNAIGITYLAPTHTSSIPLVSTTGVQNKTEFFHVPLSPAGRTSSSAGAVATGLNIELQPASPRNLTPNGGASHPEDWPTTPLSPQSPPMSQNSPSSPLNPDDDSPASTFSPFFTRSVSDNSSTVNAFNEHHAHGVAGQTPPTPPRSPFYPPSTPFFPQQTLQHENSSPNLTNINSVTSGRPRALSILYSPHGIPLSPDLMPYVQSHLVPRGALPLTVLLHSFHRSTNPWYLGGNITAGSENGAEIARRLMARCWISAHDEPKDDQGVSVMQLKTTKASPEEVRRALWDGPEGERLRRKGWNCDVRNLAAGQEVVIGQRRDLLNGVEHRLEGQAAKAESTKSPLLTPMITTDLSAWRSG